MKVNNKHYNVDQLNQAYLDTFKKLYPADVMFKKHDFTHVDKDNGNNEINENYDIENSQIKNSNTNLNSIKLKPKIIVKKNLNSDKTLVFGKDMGFDTNLNLKNFDLHKNKNIHKSKELDSNSVKNSSNNLKSVNTLKSLKTQLRSNKSINSSITNFSNSQIVQTKYKN